jgi:hypothetical protein
MSKLTNKERAAIIASTLESKKAREGLAASMVQPLRRAMNYQSLGRKVFGVQPLDDRCKFCKQSIEMGNQHCDCGAWWSTYENRWANPGDIVMENEHAE